MSQPIEAFKNSFRIPELKQRIIFTLIMLAIYRLGTHVPVPGVNGRALVERMQGASGLLGFYDMFSGGAFARATLFALGIMPYISVAIIMSLLTAVVPALERLSRQGAEGQKKITEYTRYGTVALCIIQASFIGVYLQGLGPEIVPNPGLGFLALCVISLTTGTAFIMWLGERISERGVGNGISLIIFISIVSRMPQAVLNMFNLINQGQLTIFQAMILVVLMAVVIAGAILVTTGQRRVPVQYPRQVKGRKVYAGQRNYLPLRVNQAGVIPIIFASSILMMPMMIGNAIDVPFIRTFFVDWFSMDGWLYNVSYGVLIVFFSFFYTAITFNPVEVADNMKKYGGVVMGVRPGKATAEYLNKVMTRVTLVGSLFLALVALFPRLLFHVLKVYDWDIVSFFGGTSLLILVGVALDTIRQVEQHLIMRHYDGFMKGRRMPSRRR